MISDYPSWLAACGGELSALVRGAAARGVDAGIGAGCPRTLTVVDVAAAPADAVWGIRLARAQGVLSHPL